MRIDDEPDYEEDWIGLDNVAAYDAAWARIHDGRLATPEGPEEDDDAGILSGSEEDRGRP